MATDGLNLIIPKTREFLGGDLLAQSLAALGCKVAFGLHGGHLDAFLMGCSDANIDLVDTRHETVAIQAAEGYAKVSGNVGVCFVTANSGYVNNNIGVDDLSEVRPKFDVELTFCSSVSATVFQAFQRHSPTEVLSFVSPAVLRSEMPKQIVFKASTTRSSCQSRLPNSVTG